MSGIKERGDILSRKMPGPPIIVGALFPLYHPSWYYNESANRKLRAVTLDFFFR